MEDKLHVYITLVLGIGETIWFTGSVFPETGMLMRDREMGVHLTPDPVMFVSRRPQQQVEGPGRRNIYNLCPNWTRLTHIGTNMGLLK